MGRQIILRENCSVRYIIRRRDVHATSRALHPSAPFTSPHLSICIYTPSNSSPHIVSPVWLSSSAVSNSCLLAANLEDTCSPIKVHIGNDFHPPLLMSFTRSLALSLLSIPLEQKHEATNGEVLSHITEH